MYEGMPPPAIACRVNICEADGEPALAECRPMSKKDLKGCEVPNVEWLRYFPIPESDSFVCANEALLRYSQKTGFYKLASKETDSQFFAGILPRIKALMANERRLCNYMRSIKQHIASDISLCLFLI
eukprot:Gregarina_sp_Poly_1__2824@NODE_1788_length_3328_cov_62_804048_g1165_i0_p1_GENE_NODE_1788_length_3328_cov_62_804048_g1165_i0NODE_1788_length_3328_cov_62_804048_g1165_i0_p1_ORF_typecomplete_len127_score13_69DUF4242/PF14026_6/0_11_NODE_1788_length_3328_cov_62_804048_g1165_i017862166